MDYILGVIYIVGIMGVYFLPAIIAHNNNHPEADKITLFVLCFGWTVVMWFICLSAALDRNSKL